MRESHLLVIATESILLLICAYPLIAGEISLAQLRRILQYNEAAIYSYKGNAVKETLVMGKQDPRSGQITFFGKAVTPERSEVDFVVDCSRGYDYKVSMKYIYSKNSYDLSSGELIIIRSVEKRNGENIQLVYLQ